MEMSNPRKSKRSVRKYLAVTGKNPFLLLKEDIREELSCLFSQSNPTGQLGIFREHLDLAAARTGCVLPTTREEILIHIDIFS